MTDPRKSFGSGRAEDVNLPLRSPLSKEQIEVRANKLEKKLLGFANIRPEYPCWMATGDAGPSYCRACAQKKATETGDEVDGGYRRYENDGCCHCDGCGVVLDYELTEYGVWEEIAHFQKRRFRAPVAAEEAFHIGCLLRDAPMYADALPHALRIATRFAGKLP